jgi:hypothetical protein
MAKEVTYVHYTPIDGMHVMFDTSYKLFRQDDFEYSIKPSVYDHSWTDEARADNPAVRIRDHGDGVMLKFARGGVTLDLDYSEWEQLRILIDAYEQGEDDRQLLTRLVVDNDEFM